MVNYKDVPMAVGKMRVYDFGDIKLHAYQTNVRSMMMYLSLKRTNRL